MLVCGEDVGAACAPLRGSLCVAEVGFDERSDFIHETCAKDPSEGSRKLQRTLSVSGVRTLFFGNPDAEVNVDSEDKRLVPVVGINKIKGLAQEVSRKRDAGMVDFIGPVV